MAPSSSAFRPRKSSDRIILAYDKPDFGFPDHVTLKSLVPYIGMLKVGHQAMATPHPEGTVAIAAAKAQRLEGGALMYDAKLKDIENTVVEAVRALALWPVPPKIVTIDANMRTKTIVAALKAAKGTGMLIAGVTALTDHNDDDCGDIYGKDVHYLVRYGASRLWEASVVAQVPVGIVCAPGDLQLIKEHTNLVKITPNIGRQGSRNDDQNKARGRNAREAIEAGADYIIVGRSIWQSPNPLDAILALGKDIADVKLAA